MKLLRNPDFQKLLLEYPRAKRTFLTTIEDKDTASQTNWPSESRGWMGAFCRPLRGFTPFQTWLPTVEMVGYIFEPPYGTKTNYNEPQTHALLHQLPHALRVGYQGTAPAHQICIAVTPLALLWRDRAREQDEGVGHWRHGGPRACPPLDSLYAFRREIRPTSQGQFVQMDSRHIQGALGYGAFSIGVSGVEDTTKYIQGQAKHHRKTTFKGEIEVFLKKHGMEYVDRDLE